MPTTILRHLLSVAALPGTVLLAVPWWIARTHGVHLAPGASAGALALQASGAALLAIGASLAAASVIRFAGEGRGTLAPWDPPRAFVVHGPYQFVRNPMISGVIACLFGEACVLRSFPHLVWALSFLAGNLAYIPWVEEPQLEKRFGEPYRDYCRHVRRFVPRARPWRPAP